MKTKNSLRRLVILLPFVTQLISAGPMNSLNDVLPEGWSDLKSNWKKDDYPLPHQRLSATNSPHDDLAANWSHLKFDWEIPRPGEGVSATNSQDTHLMSPLASAGLKSICTQGKKRRKKENKRRKKENKRRKKEKKPQLIADLMQEDSDPVSETPRLDSTDILHHQSSKTRSGSSSFNAVRNTQTHVADSTHHPKTTSAFSSGPTNTMSKLPMHDSTLTTPETSFHQPNMSENKNIKALVSPSPTKFQSDKNHPPVKSLDDRETPLFPVNQLRRAKAFQYKLVDFNPSKIDEELVIEAIYSLKLPNNQPAFEFIESDAKSNAMTPKQPTTNSRKLPCLYTTPKENGSQFFLAFKFAVAKYLTPSTAKKSWMQPYTVATWRDLVLSKKTYGPAAERFQLYSDHVLEEFRSSISNLKEKVVQNRIEQKRLNDRLFDRVMNKIFPVYLFHVDLISSIIPVEHFVLARKTLGEERSKAGKNFLEFIELVQSLRDRNTETREIRDIIDDSVITYKSFECEKGKGLIWKALDFWMLKSRSELKNLTGEVTTPQFKSFFTSLFTSWYTNFGKDTPNSKQNGKAYYETQGRTQN